MKGRATKGSYFDHMVLGSKFLEPPLLLAAGAGYLFQYMDTLCRGGSNPVFRRFLEMGAILGLRAKKTRT
jgi:hypothetical protein